MSLLFKISYGLYVLSASCNGKDNGCMTNTFVQQTSSPERFSITVNKLNFTHDMVLKSGKCAVAVLGKNTKFDTIKNFGMQSGKTADKFAGLNAVRTQSGILVPTDGVIGYFDLKVENSIDMGTHTLFVLSTVENKIIGEGEPLTYAFYQSDIKPKPQPSAADNKERWVCKVCGYIHEGPLPNDFICPICKHPASDFEKLIENTESKAQENKAQTQQNKNILDNKGVNTMAKFVCSICGYVYEGDAAPEKCPLCKAPSSKFNKQDDTKMVWAAEHIVGIANGVPEDIHAGLKANFEGECCEVGMYLAMSRVAHREGYPEIGLYWEKAALEEAEHAAKFAEMLGEVVCDSTKINLEKRVMAENGATKGKFDLAKRAKEENLDAIHDTVHEMAKDEARHGKAFEGLLNRYFK